MNKEKAGHIARDITHNKPVKPTTDMTVRPAMSGLTPRQRDVIVAQQTIGNQAVLGFLADQRDNSIQREPTDELRSGDEVNSKGEVASEPQSQVPPSFARASPNEPLPGDRVDGLTDKKTPYTEKDRAFLKDALFTRHQQNAQNVPLFVSNYVSALLRIWTGYVTEEMVKAGEDSGWSFLASLAGLVIRESLIALLFPEIELERLAAKVAYALVEKTAAVALEKGQGAIEESEGASKREKRGHELRSKSKEIGTQLESVIFPAMTHLADDFHYSEWLADASLIDLHLFRLPHAIPPRSEGQIGAQVAEAMAGAVHDDESVAITRFGDNTITVSLKPSKQGQAIPNYPPSFEGAEALAEELGGQTIRNLPHMPLFVELHDDGSYFMALLRVLPEGKAMADKLKFVTDAWPYQSPFIVTRDPQGSVIPNPLSGNLFEMVHVFERANPTVEFISQIVAVLQDIDIHDYNPYHNLDADDPVSRPLTPVMAAQQLFEWLQPGMSDGAKFLVNDSVLPLKTADRKQHRE